MTSVPLWSYRQTSTSSKARPFWSRASRISFFPVCSTRIDGSEGRFPVFYRYFPDDRDDIRQLVELPEQEMAARRLRQCEQGAGMNAIQVIEILGFIVEHQQVVLPVGVFQADELVER